jgi:hypothetical protein
MIRYFQLGIAAAIAALSAPQVQAATIFWQSNATAALTGPNWNDGAPNKTPNPIDVLNVGLGGTATHSVAGPTTFARMRIGHNQSTPAPGGAGQGTVTITNGAVNLTNAATSLQVGQVQTGTLNIDGAVSSLTTAGMIFVGDGTNTNRTGTINITNGGSLTATTGNIALGSSSGTNVQGVQGHMFVNGNVTITDGAGDLNIGIAGATSSYTQTGGNLSVGDVIEIGTQPSTNSNSFFSVSGGTVTNGLGPGANAGNLIVGRGASIGATVNVSGTAIVNVGNRFLMGGSTDTTAATGVVMNHSGGTLNTDRDIRVADAFPSDTSDATYNFSGGVINSTTGGIVGRQGIGKFLQTGGTANFNGALSIGNREVAPLATNGLYEISAGDLNVQTALNIAPNGTGELRVIGDDATIDVTGSFSVNNTANGTGTLAYELEAGDSLSMISVAGTATFNSGSVLHIDASNTTHEQFHYNLLTAPTIVDNGVTFSAPPGWWYRIIDGGNGKILQAIVPESSSIALMFMTLGVTLRRRRHIQA